MKKDILFFILVLIAGLTGFFYTNRSTDDILVAKKEDNKKKPPAKSTDIKYQKRTGNTSAEYSADITSDLIEAAQPEIEAGIDDTPKLEAPTVVEDPKTWPQIFDHWKLVLIDNTTAFTKIADISQSEYCVVNLSWTTGKHQAFNINAKLKLDIKNMSLHVDPDGKEDVFVLKRLRNAESMAIATQKLINYCTQDSQS